MAVKLSGGGNSVLRVKCHIKTEISAHVVEQSNALSVETSTSLGEDTVGHDICHCQRYTTHRGKLKNDLSAES